MRSSRLFLFAALAGAATFAAALYFQYVKEMHPCTLCMWQRYALGVGIAGALLAFFVPAGRVLFGLIGFAGFASESAVAMFHTGVERKWWEGLQSCSGGGGLDNFNAGDFASALAKGGVPRCDEIPWEFLGLSMANYNVVIAAALAVMCAVAALRGTQSGYRQP